MSSANRSVDEAALLALRSAIGDRYEPLELLGRGGMACVYRVRERASGRELALKQLVLGQGTAERSTAEPLFEREFHTLAQLRHPHVIAVYDYGRLADESPYYTMELLDGGDLRDRAPVPWRECCRLLFDVCSSLALLHSRRLLHRDISPRNIRCTRDGRAKLIDFGAMVPMSTGGVPAVGTPAFIAPETLHRLALDARTDLFSLGATLYHALTGRLPFAARTFADAVSAWNTKVAPPSKWTPDVPATLDDLVLALLSIEPALRPPSAFEVMQRLAAIGGLESSESDAVSRAYLATPTLVGRDAPLFTFREQLLKSRMSRSRALAIEAPSGAGRSRFLDACALEAKTLGFTVLRATAGASGGPLSTARDLARHLHEAVPSADLGDTPAAELAQAIGRMWLEASRTHPLLFAVDDAHRIDAESAAVFASLLDQSRLGGIFVMLTADRDEARSAALDALVRRAIPLTLGPLTREQTRELLASLFGEASNLDMLAAELYQVALGNPRQSMDMAQHLVDRGVIRYASGTWTLPSSLSAEDLPRSGDAALRARVAALSPEARFFGETQALAFYEGLRDQDYRALLPEAPSEAIERALSELLSIQALASDGKTYTLSNRLWKAAFRPALDPSDLEARHRALAAMYSQQLVPFIYHAFAGGLEREGHAALAKLNAQIAEKLDHDNLVHQNVGKMMQCYPRALESAERLGMSKLALNELRRWNLAGMSTVEDAGMPESTPLWFAQIEYDSGLDVYRADPDASDSMARLMRALTRAQERYQATPELERVYNVEDAIRRLAEYVIYGIVVGSRTHSAEILRSLPGVLEPFAVLSPLLGAIWNNARATHASQTGALELAHELWTDVLAKLDAMTDGDMYLVSAIANAVAFAIGNMEAQFGLAHASNWADRLDKDAAHRLSALQLRRIVRLEQGDWRSAERYRRQAEILALQLNVVPLFKSLLPVELVACFLACDLAGVRDVMERMRPIAAQHPGWIPNLLFAQACFHSVRGDFEAAVRDSEACIARSAFDSNGHSPNGVAWFAGQQCLTESLLSLERPEEARASAQRALSTWNAYYTGSPPADLVRVLALAEAKLGTPGAAERVEALIASQVRIGVSGLVLGLSYEARARIAIWQRDAAAFDRFAELTAREYRYGNDSPLGARYDRLLNEAGRHGLSARHALSDFAGGDDRTIVTGDLRGTVSRSLSQGRDPQERAKTALQLICASRQARAGHLFLMSEEGWALRASEGAAAPASLLSEVRAFTARRQAEADAMDDMATGELLETSTPRTTIELGVEPFELLLLSCVIDGQRNIAGVAAIAANDNEADPAHQNELLHALAAQLLEAGDVTVAAG